MKPKRLQEIREYASELFNPHRLGDLATVELIEYVDQLAGERDRARDLAVRSGVFQDDRDDESKWTHELEFAPGFGPVPTDGLVTEWRLP